MQSNDQNVVRSAAKQRLSFIYDTLSNSELTMVHDTAGECSPNVAEALREKKKLAVTIAKRSIVMELDSLDQSWPKRIFFKKKRESLIAEHDIISNTNI